MILRQVTFLMSHHSHYVCKIFIYPILKRLNSGFRHHGFKPRHHHWISVWSWTNVWISGVFFPVNRRVILIPRSTNSDVQEIHIYFSITEINIYYECPIHLLVGTISVVSGVTLILNLSISSSCAWCPASQILRHQCLEMEKDLFELAETSRWEPGFAQIPLPKNRKQGIL